MDKGRIVEQGTHDQLVAQGRALRPAAGGVAIQPQADQEHSPYERCRCTPSPLLLLAAMRAARARRDHRERCERRPRRPCRRAIPPRSTAVGVVTPRTSRSIAVQTSTAASRKLVVNDGQRVKAGDLIAQLDTTQLEEPVREGRSASATPRAAEEGRRVRAGRRGRSAQLRAWSSACSASARARPRRCRRARAQAATAPMRSGARAEPARASAEAKTRSSPEETPRRTQDSRADRRHRRSSMRSPRGRDAQKGMTFARVFDPQQLAVQVRGARATRAQGRRAGHAASCCASELDHEVDRRVTSMSTTATSRRSTSAVVEADSTNPHRRRRRPTSRVTLPQT